MFCLASWLLSLAVLKFVYFYYRLNYYLFYRLPTTNYRLFTFYFYFLLILNRFHRIGIRSLVALPTDNNHRNGKNE